MNNEGFQEGATGIEPGKGGESYTNAAVRGSAWGFFQTIFSKVLSVIVQLILARLLFPSDFGLVAIALGTISIISIFSPLPIIDLLVQRGKNIANALVNAWRLCILCALIIGVGIAASSLIVSIRPGQVITINEGVMATPESTLAEFNTNPPFPEILRNAEGSFEIHLDGKWEQIELPPAPSPDTTIVDYAALVQEQIDEVAGGDKVLVRFNEGTAKMEIKDADGGSLDIRSWSSREGAVLDTLGVEYHSIVLMILLLVLAIRPLLIAMRVPFAALMRLELRFGQLAGVNLVSNGSGHLSAITFALLGAGPLALVAPQIVFPILAAILMYFLVRPVRTAPREQRERKRTIARDSAFLWGAQWIHTATLQTPYLILGFFVSSREVGYFYFAFLLSVQIILMLSNNVSSALTPIFSNLQDDKERLASAFIRSVGAMAGISIPLFLAATASVSVFLPILFGERWSPSIPLLVILLGSQALASTNNASGSLLKGSGRYKTWLFLQIGQGVILLTAVVIASWLGGTEAVAWTMLGQQVVFAPLSIYLCVHGHVRKRAVARVHLIPLIACIPMIPVGIVLARMGPTLMALLVWMPILLASASVVYIVIMRVLDRERYEELTNIIAGIKRKALGMISR